MSRVFLAVRGNWLFLQDALEAVGHEVVTYQQQRDYADMHPVMVGDAATIDLRKALSALEATELQPLADLQFSWRFASYIRQLCADVDVIVVTYTADVLGLAAVEGGKMFGKPVIHLQHACYSVLPEDAWYLKEYPGDLVLAPGERDRQWWQRCNPEAKVLVTGNPMWDVYHGLVRKPTDLPTILWVCESGANAYQSATIWKHRDTPKRAYAMFLAALKQVTVPTRLLLKARATEDESLMRAWAEQASQTLSGSQVVQVVVTTEQPWDVLPQVSLAVGVESNLLVEAEHLGIGTINLGQPGVCLLPNWTVVASDALPNKGQAHSLARYVERCLSYDWKKDATYFNRGTDGQAMRRFVDVVGQVVHSGMESVEKALVTA